MLMVRKDTKLRCSVCLRKEREKDEEKIVKTTMKCGITVFSLTHSLSLGLLRSEIRRIHVNEQLPKRRACLLAFTLSLSLLFRAASIN